MVLFASRKRAENKKFFAALTFVFLQHTEAHYLNHPVQ
jgi:hypothetical protein